MPTVQALNTRSATRFTIAQKRSLVSADDPIMELSAESASQFALSQTQSQVAMAVAKKALDQQRAEGQAAIQLLESASRVTENSQASVGGCTNCGGVDLYA